MKTKILLSVIAIMFVAILYLLYLNFSPKKVVETYVPKTGNLTIPTSEPTKPTNPTVNWKTYENKEYGIFFKYPSSWQTEGFPGSGDVSWTIPGQSGPFVLTLLIKDNLGKSLDDFIKRDQFPYDLIKKKNNWTIVSDPTTEGSSVIVAFLNYNQKIYSLTLQSDPPKINTDPVALLDQILSTFKFTNTTNTNNWTKRSNGDFESKNDCLWFSTSKASDTGDLEQYVKKYYQTDSLEPLINSTKYTVQNYQTITISPQGVGELFTVYFPVNDKKYSITFGVTSQDDILETDKCKNYQQDINFVLNNIEQFI